MDNFFGKFGICDFMGVWGPGAMFVLYSMITTIYINQVDILSSIENLQCDYSLLIIFAFCLLSYFCGVIFHELGKGISDMIKPFDLNTIFRLRSKRLLFLKKRLIKFTLSIDENKYTSKNPSVYDAMNYIRNNNIDKMARIDKSRSIYGFSRGSAIGIIAHAILLVVYAFAAKSWNSIIGFSIIDLFLCTIFLFRTFRYKYIWIEKAFIVYDSLN